MKTIFIGALKKITFVLILIVTLFVTGYIMYHGISTKFECNDVELFFNIYPLERFMNR